MASILNMVIEKPMLLTIVSAVPVFSFGADWATSVENCGESEITVVLQVNIKTRKRKKGIL